jgi:hypothetical protein
MAQRHIMAQLFRPNLSRVQPCAAGGPLGQRVTSTNF